MTNRPTLDPSKQHQLDVIQSAAASTARWICPELAEDARQAAFFAFLRSPADASDPLLRTIGRRVAERIAFQRTSVPGSRRRPVTKIVSIEGVDPQALAANPDSHLWRTRVRARLLALARELALEHVAVDMLAGVQPGDLATPADTAKRYSDGHRLRVALRSDPLLLQLLKEGP